MRKMAEKLYLLSHGKDFAKERDIAANELRILEESLKDLEADNRHEFLLCILQNICNVHRLNTEFLNVLETPDVKLEDYMLIAEDVVDDSTWTAEMLEVADYQIRQYNCCILDKRTGSPIADKNVLSSLCKQLEDYRRRKEFSLSNWEQYDLVDSKEDFIRLWNILEAHGENLSMLYEAKGSFSGFCGVYGEWRNDRAVVDALFEHHVFYNSYEDYKTVVAENAECEGMTVEEYMKYEKYSYTLDGVIRHIEF